MSDFAQRRLILFAFLVSWTVPNLLAQESAPSHQATIDVLVTASTGSESLKTNELSAFVDSHPAQIQKVVHAQPEPLVFAVLLDVSGSSQNKQPYETESALNVFRAFAVGSNVAYFGDFNEELYLSHKPASLESVMKELKEIGKPRGGTALHDAVLEAAKLVRQGARGTTSRRAVIVITDGEDSASNLSLKQLIPELQKQGVPIFCIGLLDERSRRNVIMELGTISDSSGGIAHLLTHKTDFIPSLVSELENEYWIKMTFPFTADGKLHSLTLKANRPDLRIAAPAAVPLQ